MRSLHRSAGLVKLAALPQANIHKRVFMATLAGGNYSAGDVAKCLMIATVIYCRAHIV